MAKIREYDIPKEEIFPRKTQVETPKEWVDLFQKYRFNISILSEMTNIKRSTLSNKLNPEHYSKLTIEEYREVQRALIVLVNEVDKAISVYPIITE